MHRMSKTVAISTILALLMGHGAQASAQNVSEIGLRANVLLGDGTPANDMLGAGLVGRFLLFDGWFVAATLDAYDYDFERPHNVAGIDQDPAVETIDSTIRSVAFGAAIGRQIGDRSGFDWFWSAGVGVGFPDPTTVSGPVAGGGTFDLAIDAKTEIHLSGTVGTMYYLSDRWSVTAAARAEHHFLDISVVDQISGASGKVTNQTPLGAYLSINVTF